jgi:hypothetical protein
MATLAAVLFPEPTLRRHPLALLRWWEAKRPTYNAIVGTSGLLALLVLHLTAFPVSGLLELKTWAISVAFGVAANICYSAGWVSELVLQRLLGREAYGLGPALFRHGLVFSVGLTWFPVGIAAFMEIAEIVYRLVR